MGSVRGWQAEQVRQKDAALAERTAYVAKLEWRLLCQHKVLEGAGAGAKKPPLGRLKVPGARTARSSKPQLPGTRSCTQGREGCSAACHFLDSNFEGSLLSHSLN